MYGRVAFQAGHAVYTVRIFLIYFDQRKNFMEVILIISVFHILSHVLLLLLLISVEPTESRLAHCSLSRLIVLNPVLVPQFISRGAPRQTA
jgi:hypothetical protein